MIKKTTKQGIKEFIKSATYSNDKGLVLHKARIYIADNELKKMISYVGDNDVKYDKSTNVTHFIESYLNKESNLKDTTDIIYDYVKDMIEEYNEETKELEFYKKIDNK